jgi:phenylpropionate dioxygenase-like ring-hydroxylating dioxygenase large terminal subunit
MGEMLRQYWIPAAMSSELKADGAPVRLKLLDEKLIAFRDSSGRVGIMDHRCPHRCASLFYGRNEENGLRCVYHGWKFDADGKCVDMPNLPPHQDFKDKVRAKAYRVHERNGLIWIYMGARAEPPPLPAYEAALLPETEVRISFAQRECNWLQAFEGDIDTSHFSFLHFGGVGGDDVPPDEVAKVIVSNRGPEFASAETDWGMMYGAHRTTDDGSEYWRVAHFMFPFWSLPPHGDMKDHVWTRAWVPMDDTHTMFVELSWTGRTLGLRTLKDGSTIPGIAAPTDLLPNTTDWLGRFRPRPNAGNDYFIDREAQRSESYSGISGIFHQDQAVTESMGEIVDHSFEYLAPSDQMITQTRRRLLKAARDYAKDGTAPPGVDDPEIFLGARGGDMVIGPSDDWIRAYAERKATLDNPTGRLEAAE